MKFIEFKIRIDEERSFLIDEMVDAYRPILLGQIREAKEAGDQESLEYLYRKLEVLMAFWHETKPTGV